MLSSPHMRYGSGPLSQLWSRAVEQLFSSKAPAEPLSSSPTHPREPGTGSPPRSQPHTNPVIRRHIPTYALSSCKGKDRACGLPAKWEGAWGKQRLSQQEATLLGCFFSQLEKTPWGWPFRPAFCPGGGWLRTLAGAEVRRLCDCSQEQGGGSPDLGGSLIPFSWTGLSVNPSIAWFVEGVSAQ